MEEDQIKDGLASIGASYLKRWLEQHYDSLMRSQAARKLMEANTPTRYGIEAGLYTLVAYADQRWSPDSPLGAMAREVLKDAPSELSKRLVNGFREEVLAAASEEKSKTAANIESALLQLDDKSLARLLNWLSDIPPEERAQINARMTQFSTDELEKLTRLSPQDLSALFNYISEPPEKEKPREPRRSKFAQTLRDELEKAHQKADAELAESSERKKE